ncbi:uncharacterized protein LOC141860603 isoform X3 [Acropora palmata]|uniref:uncharacterized protein LOC141860603 isoform X3 n=2 Tax=Acropora palmata TaxID=6131 RepID=UPI003D9FC2CC
MFILNRISSRCSCCEMMAQKDELEPIPIHRRDFLSSAGRHAPQMLKNDGGSADGYGVYGFMRDLILEGKVAKWVNNSGRYVLDWSRALDRYADYEAKKNPLFKSTNQGRGKASKRLRKALLNVHKKDGAKEYMESKKVNEKGQVVERQLQMPPRVFESLFRNAELSDSGQEQDERERMRPLSEGLEVTPESSTDSGFDETMDLSCELSVPQHSGNDLKRSMEDCSQQKIATIVYRAGTKEGPSFDSDENINEGNFYLSIHWSCITLSFMYQIS